MAAATQFLAKPWVRWAIIGLVVVLLIVLPLILPAFANQTLARIGVFAVAVLGLNVVMGYTGQVSLGQIFFVGVGAYVTAYGVNNDWNIALVFILAVLIPGVIGLLIALAAARLGGLAIAMVTIALPLIGVPLAKRLSEFTGGSQGSSARFSAAPEWTGLYDDQWQLYIVIAIAGIVFLLTRNLVHGKYGRAFAIVKGNEAVASSMGISPYRYKVLAFTIASLIGGVSGFLYMVVVQYTSPETMSFGHSITLLASMVIGGAGSILGLSARRRLLRARAAADERRRLEPHRRAAGRHPPGDPVRAAGGPRLAAAALAKTQERTPRDAGGRRRGGAGRHRHHRSLRPQHFRTRTHPTHTVTREEAGHMSTLRKRLRVTSVVAGIGIVAVLVAGCARGGDTGDSGGDASEGPAEASPGITDTTLTFGITSPLTGATAGPGNCTVDGALAYFGVKNDEGGIEFGDGKTRTIEIKAYDDAYDPQKALANFQQMVSDGVFAAGVGLGTPTNRAWREAAIDEGVPQVLVMTGDPIFSDRAESPEQIGLVPIYQQEGGAFGELLASSTDDHKVAILSQNDDYGNGYVEGFMDAIEGADNIEVVKALTYEATDTSVDAQLTELASTGADVFVNAMSITPLVISSLKKTEELGWKPSWFLPSNTSSPGGILQQPDVHADVFPGIYTVAFSQSAASPTFADSDDGKAFLDAIAKYTNQEGVPAFPHCVWSWIAAATLEQAFTKMEEPTRESFMEALMSIKDYSAPFMLEGSTIDTTQDGKPAVSAVQVQKYNGKGYAPAESFGG